MRALVCARSTQPSEPAASKNFRQVGASSAPAAASCAITPCSSSKLPGVPRCAAARASAAASGASSGRKLVWTEVGIEDKEKAAGAAFEAKDQRLRRKSRV